MHLHSAYSWHLNTVLVLEASSLLCHFSVGAIQLKIYTKDLFHSLGNAFSNSVSHGRSEEIKRINVRTHFLVVSGDAHCKLHVLK